MAVKNLEKETKLNGFEKIIGHALLSLSDFLNYHSLFVDILCLFNWYYASELFINVISLLVNCTAVSLTIF